MKAYEDAGLTKLGEISQHRTAIKRLLAKFAKIKCAQNIVVIQYFNL